MSINIITINIIVIVVVVNYILSIAFNCTFFKMLKIYFKTITILEKYSLYWLSLMIILKFHYVIHLEYILVYTSLF